MPNIYLSANIDDDEATVLQLEVKTAIEIAKYIHARFPNNQTAAAKNLGLSQGEVSALLSANLKRFSLERLVKIARRAGLHLVLDMGASAHTASVQRPLRPASSTTRAPAAPLQELLVYDAIVEPSPAQGETDRVVQWLF